MLSFLKKQIKYSFLAILLGIAILVWYAVFWESRDGLLVAFLDVGQGDAIFIQAQNGNQVLLDGGPNKAVLRQLSKVMPFYDRSIDMIMNSHPHSDHLAGLIEVSKRYDINSVIESCVNHSTPEYREWENFIKNKEIYHLCAKRGMKINIDENLSLEILLPAVDAKNLDPHTGMLIAKLIYGHTAYLLMGDAEKSLENYLFSLDGSKLKSDVLKVGHHGSRKSTSESLLGFSNSQYAVISVGKDNSYGHPHKETLEILNRFRIKILRTDELGMIKIKSDGNKISVAE
jgi:competence protein ComEC